MTFTVSSKAINDALVILSKVIASKNVLPILDDFIIRLEGDTLHMTAADTENMMTATVCITEGNGEGCFAVNAKSMMEALKNMEEIPLTFEFDEDTSKVKVSYQNGVFSLPTDKPDEFPQPYSINPTLTMSIPENILQENIARTVFATAQDELRPVMNGIFFDLTEESLNVVASDGHQLVRNKILSIRATEDNNGSFILPKKPAHIMKNTLRKTDAVVSITADDSRVQFITDTFTLNSRLIEGRYPNYNSVIPKNNPNTLTVDRNTLMAALKRVSPFANSNSQLMRFQVQQHARRSEAEDYDFSKTAAESMTADYDGNDMSIGFKSSTLLGILDNIKSTEVQMLLADPSRAGLILPSEQPEQQEILMLIMPMLLND